MAVANELPSPEDKARTASATGTTQLLEHAILLLLFAGLVIGGVATLRHRNPVRHDPGHCRVAAARVPAPMRAEARARCHAAAAPRARRCCPAPVGGGARPRRAANARGESSPGLHRQLSAGPLLAWRSADR